MFRFATFSPGRTLGGVCFTLALLLTSPWLNAEPLRVAISPDYDPLAFMRDGKIVGIEADNAAEVARQLGRPLQFVPMPMLEFIAALEDNKVDVVMSGFSITPEREAQVAFAAPFMRIGQMAIILADTAASNAQPRAMYRPGMRIGVEQGTTGDTYAREHFPEAILQYYPDPQTAFTALRERVADVFLHDAPTSWGLAASREDQDLLSLYRPLTTEALAWAVRRDNQVLLGQLNTALQQMQANGRLQAIQNYWIPITVQVR